MHRDPERPFNIVVGFDFSELGKLALAESFGLASLNPKTVLHIIGVVDATHGLGPVQPKGRSDYDTAQEVQAELKKAVEEKIDKYKPAEFRFYIHARIGAPQKEILQLAEEANADLIVVGTHGRHGVRRWLVGSVAERVVRNASCPVLVMRPKPTGEEAVAEGGEAATTDEQFQPEPACPHCVVTRIETNGAEWWCEEHSKPHVQPHRYSYSDGIRHTRQDEWSTFNK